MKLPKQIYAIPEDQNSVLDGQFFAHGLKDLVSSSGSYSLPSYSALGCAEQVSGNQYRFLGQIISITPTTIEGIYRAS